MSKTLTRVQRDKQIRAKRASGRYTLADLSEEYGLTRERIRQIALETETVPKHKCRKCKSTFFANRGWAYCEDCRNPKCKTCGKELGRYTTSGYCRTNKKAGTRCNPNYFAHGGATYRAIEQGVFVRHYLGSGRRLPGYFTSKGGDMHRFETLKEVRAWRAKNIKKRRPNATGPGTWQNR